MDPSQLSVAALDLHTPTDDNSSTEISNSSKLSQKVKQHAFESISQSKAGRFSLPWVQEHQEDFNPFQIRLDHTSDEWEQQRENFTRLYMTDDKSLKEVQEIMEKEHGFGATERQYKRRIVQWKLEKNVKDSDMRVIARKQLKRKLEMGKESEFSVNGRPVQMQKVERFAKRKGLADGDILAENSETPPYISCHTPSDPMDSVQEAEDSMLDHYPTTIPQMLSHEPSKSLVNLNPPPETFIFRMDENRHVESIPTVRTSGQDVIDWHGSERNVQDYQPTVMLLEQQKKRRMEIARQEQDHNQLAPPPTINLLANSPFERCSPRYHISESPSWYQSAMTPSNPLSILSPFVPKSMGTPRIAQTSEPMIHSTIHVKTEDVSFTTSWEIDGYYAQLKEECIWCRKDTTVVYRSVFIMGPWEGKYGCECVPMREIDALRSPKVVDSNSATLRYRWFNATRYHCTRTPRDSRIFSNSANFTIADWE